MYLTLFVRCSCAMFVGLLSAGCSGPQPGQSDSTSDTPVAKSRPNEPAASQNETCIVSGCSGQICSDEERMSTCEFKAEYACYKDALCERQSDGECGWTPTPALTQCLSEDGAARYEPCGDKTCGDPCTVCRPGDPACTELAGLKWCNQRGECEPNKPNCDL